MNVSIFDGSMLVLLVGWRICCNLSYYCISSKFWVVFCDNVLVIFWDLEWPGLWEMDIVKVRLLKL